MRISTQGIVAPLIGSVVVCLSGCITVGLHADDFARPTVRAELGAAGVHDRRSEFREAFCRHYNDTAAPGAEPCERWMVGAPAASGVAAPAPVRQGAPPAVVVIPGIFGECVDRWVTPYSHDRAYLERMGYQVYVIKVTGRGSSAVNAQKIHEFFAAHPIGRAVVIAYSKGTTDFMTAAVQPASAAWTNRIAAFVSVAGVVNGTPLASRGDHFYNNYLANVPLELCQPSDGGGVSSLTYQAAWQTANTFARIHKTYPTYSLAAVADKAALNPVLQATYDLLAKLDTRNDGQVLVEDAIVPGSSFLGMFRADHWSIALPFADSGAPEMRAFSIHNRFPRRALIGAVLEFVDK